MDSGKRIGVVTVTYNSSKVIAQFMESVLHQSHQEFILYIVENASSDETLKLLSQYQDSRIALIPNRTNVGVAEGNNVGIRAALKDGCDFVLLINNDTVFGPDLFSNLLDGLTRHDCAMIVPKIMYADDPQKIWCAGGYLSDIRASGFHFGNGQTDVGQFDEPRIVNYSPTCCMLIRQDVFSKTGLMDKDYFAYFDDTDFCFRAFQLGIRMYYLPSVKLFHKVGSLTSRESSQFHIKYGARNHVYYLLKHFPLWQCILYLPLLQIHYLFKFLFRLGSPKTFWMVQQAFMEGISLYMSRLARS
ncbi:MAG TPA: glycosyltransferase family 2 protein [Candidatus Acidoferrum sp.]